MPVFSVRCKREACGWRSGFVRPSASALKRSLAQETRCGGCGELSLEREAPGQLTGLKVVETIDDRCRPYPVERLADAERLYQERAANASPEAGKSLR